MENEPGHATIVRAEVFAAELSVELSDGRRILVPLAAYPRLAKASARERSALRMSPFGLHWDGLDEDIGITSLLTEFDLGAFEQHSNRSSDAAA